MVTTEGLLAAYLDCRRRKRRTASAIEYGINHERRIVALRDRINDRTYVPGASVCFVVTRPRYREVFAAAFEDRIVHHWVCLRLEPLLEATLGPRTFSCRKGKGQLAAVTTLRDDIRECSENYTRDCWCAKFDIRGFFMSIDRARLAAMIDRFIVENYKGDDVEDLRWLTRIIVTHAPESDCELHSPKERWTRLPANKSLFTNGEGRGMPIGNLPSQLLANFLLSPLDRMVTEELGLRFYGRYVDDFYVVDRDKAKILAAAPVIRERLKGLGLELHPKKFYLQHYTKGVPFVGMIVRRDRVYAGNGTVRNFERAVDRLNGAKGLDEVERAVPSVNSYLGLLRHFDTYAIRRRVLGGIRKELYKYLYIKGHFDAVVMKRRYTRRGRILEGLRKGPQEIRMREVDAGLVEALARHFVPIVERDGDGVRIILEDKNLNEI